MLTSQRIINTLKFGDFETSHLYNNLADSQTSSVSFGQEPMSHLEVSLQRLQNLIRFEVTYPYRLLTNIPIVGTKDLRLLQNTLRMLLRLETLEATLKEWRIGTEVPGFRTGRIYSESALLPSGRSTSRQQEAPFSRTPSIKTISDQS
ncbi:hypothetical protein BGX23_011736 [Mortierella sp. AD031]|nr:hypothetical protein BGX23_011736 [Mortierella sp. AD031]